MTKTLNQIFFSSTKIRILLDCKRTTIAPNSEVMLWGKLPSGKMYGQQGTYANSKYMLSKGLLASKSVITVSKSSQNSQSIKRCYYNT
jgi:hypothetical protein